MAAASPAPPSFDQVVGHHRDDVLRVCLSILRDEGLGADATQETFLRLWRDLCRGRPPDEVAHWLRRVAVHTSIDLLRRRRARERALPSRADDPVQVAEAGRGPARAVADAELRERYERALERLSERQRAVFLLRHEGGMSLSEVADTLEVALPTAKTQFARACLKLQALLSEFGPEIRS